MNFSARVEGQSLTNWKSVRLTRALNQLADTFEMEAVPMPGEPPCRPGERVELIFDGSTLCTGWLEERHVEHDADSHTLRLAGRALTADLVDCSVLRQALQWHKQTLVQIARDVCGPFDIAVELTPDAAMDATIGAPIRRAALQDGESAFELLERLARQVGALLSTGPQGQLRIGSPLVLPLATRLVARKNLIFSGRSETHKERFSRYLVRGQTSSSDTFPGDKAAAIEKMEEDPAIQRYRPLVVMAETPGDDLAARARWERRARWAQSLTFQVRTVGWSHGAGVWAPGDLVRLTDSSVGVDDELLITAVTLDLSEEGEIADLTLQHQEAVSSAPVPPASADPNAWAVGAAPGWVKNR